MTAVVPSSSVSMRSIFKPNVSPASVTSDFSSMPTTRERRPRTLELRDPLASDLRDACDLRGGDRTGGSTLQRPAAIESRAASRGVAISAPRAPAHRGPATARASERPARTQPSSRGQAVRVPRSSAPRKPPGHGSTFSRLRAMAWNGQVLLRCDRPRPAGRPGTGIGRRAVIGQRPPSCAPQRSRRPWATPRHAARAMDTPGPRATTGALA
jgi:hypothetical protein